MKNLFLAVVAALLLAGCGNGAKYKMVDGTIICQVPERQAAQQDMIAYAAEPMEVVRVGFIGLGMRGPGAVRRWCQIDGTEIVALCDLNGLNGEASVEDRAVEACHGGGKLDGLEDRASAKYGVAEGCGLLALAEGE